MTENIGSLEAFEEKRSISAVEMAEIGQLRYQEATDRAEFETLAERAITVAIDRPGGAGIVSETRASFMGGRDGSVGTVKADIVSDVARPGAEKPPEENKGVEDALEARVRTLYADLTDYQVAWRIAQKIPQDLSQILKGN